MKQNQTDTRSTYQTGSTNPPKNHHSMIAVMLIVMILLISVVTVSSMMNIRLFQPQEDPNAQADAYEPQEQIVQLDSQPQAVALELDLPVLGLTCEEIDNLYRVYHRLPQGLYISHIDPDSDAHQAGLLPGDVVITCDDTAITKKARFHDYINGLDDGTVVHLTVFRDGQQIAISLTV